jgi:hypothetical protein
MLLKGEGMLEPSAPTGLDKLSPKFRDKDYPPAWTGLHRATQMLGEARELLDRCRAKCQGITFEFLKHGVAFLVWLSRGST